MKLLVAIKISDVNRKKIAYDLGRHLDEDLPDETECKDWLESWMKETFDNMSEYPTTSGG